MTSKQGEGMMTEMKSQESKPSLQKRINKLAEKRDRKLKDKNK